MTELEALIAVHGAIDRAVQRDPGLARSVAPLLPAYERDDAPGWYEKFERWTKDVAPDAELVGPDEALAQMAERPPRPRQAARRLLALAALARATPDLTDDDNRRLRAALSVEGLAADNSDALFARLTGPEFESIGDWGDFIRGATADGLLAETLSAQVAAPPCSGSVEPALSSSGGVTDAASLFTTMRTDQVSFACACRFLEPVNWPGCSDFWCTMVEVATKPNGNPVFHELVSLDCNSAAAWRAEAFLEFGFSWTATVASLSYQLDPDRTAPTDPIVVDEGWLRVVDEGGGTVRVETLKTISFANSYFFSPGQLAAMMCPLGYGDAAGDLMFNCALECAPGSGTAFPGSQAADGAED
jgi:hypothetical protein